MDEKCGLGLGYSSKRETGNSGGRSHKRLHRGGRSDRIAESCDSLSVKLVDPGSAALCCFSLRLAVTRELVQ